MGQRGQSEGTNELIFSSNTKSFKFAPIPEKDATNDQVDLEIILLGPKSRKSKSGRQTSDSIRSTNSTKDIDLSEFDPFSPERESSPNGNENSGSLKQTEPSIHNQASQHDGKQIVAGKSAKEIDSSLLEQMERRFRETNIRAEDESQIDYLDYF